MAFCTREMGIYWFNNFTFNVKMSFYPNICVYIAQVFLMSLVYMAGPISILKLVYALLNQNFKCRTLQPLQNDIFHREGKGIDPTFPFPLCRRSWLPVCSTTCLNLSELDSPFNLASYFLSPVYHSVCWSSHAQKGIYHTP